MTAPPSTVTCQLVGSTWSWIASSFPFETRTLIPFEPCSSPTTRRFFSPTLLSLGLLAFVPLLVALFFFTFVSFNPSGLTRYFTRSAWMPVAVGAGLALLLGVITPNTQLLLLLAPGIPLAEPWAFCVMYLGRIPPHSLSSKYSYLTYL